MATKVRETVAVHLTPDLQEGFDEVCVATNLPVSEVLRKAMWLYASLYKLDIVGVEVDTEKALSLLNEEKSSLDEAVVKFQALRRAIEIIVEAVKK